MGKIECTSVMNLAVSKLLWSPAAPNAANRQKEAKVATDATSFTTPTISLFHVLFLFNSFGFPDQRGPHYYFFFRAI